MTADAARYEPGGQARISIRTTDADGRPVSASVVVHVVDEKLFAIQAAQEIDLLGDLYADVSNGIIGITWSHGVPRPSSEGGDTTGGGGDERDDFKDWLLFQQVTTAADGRATVTVDLSDDLTSWRVIGSAVDRGYRAGSGRVDLAVGKPFFVEAALAPSYLVGDRPVLRIRGYGSALHDGDAVSFAVTSDSLAIAGSGATGRAFQAASIELPALTAGDHRLRIVATTGAGASRHEDVLIRTIHVVDSRSVQARTVSGPLVAGFRLQGGSVGATSLVLSDGGRGRVLPELMGLLEPGTGRADQLLASGLARRVLQASFGFAAGELPAGAVDLGSFQTDSGGVAILPYASSDLELSAMAALADDPSLDADHLRMQFQDLLSGDPAPSRERRVIALAGLAALGDPVLVDIRAAAKRTDLTTVERSWLAVAAVAAGDEALAGKLERAVLDAHGERLGPWVRVHEQGAELTATTTAILAIAAAGIGDPVAGDMDAFLAANPPKDTVLDLHRAIAARSWAERTPGAAAAASLTELVPARPPAVSRSRRPSRRGSASAGPLATAALTPVRGTVLVTSHWEGPLDARSLQAKNVTTFTRTVGPTGTIPIDGLVTVEFTVHLGADADHGCWQVTDLVPSGLAPVWGGPSWYRGQDYDEEGTPTPDALIAPWNVEGQRVDFCLSPDPKHPVQHLRYVARVVSPGTYRWESPVIQSSIVPDYGMVLPAAELVIAK